MHQCNAGSNGGFRGVSYNPAENAVLLTTDHEGGSYELFSIPKDASGTSVVSDSSLFAWHWSHPSFTWKSLTLSLLICGVCGDVALPVQCV